MGQSFQEPTRVADCPYCLQPGAKRWLWLVKCPNAGCPKYDEKLQTTLLLTKHQRQSTKGSTPAIDTLDPTRPRSDTGSLLSKARRALAITLIVIGVATWLMGMSGMLPAEIPSKHAITIAVLGFMLLPSRKPRPARQQMPKEEAEEP